MLSPVKTDAKIETSQTFSYANDVGSCCVLLPVAMPLDISPLIPRVLFVLLCFVFFQIALINLNIIKAFKTDHRKYVYRQKLKFNLERLISKQSKSGKQNNEQEAEFLSRNVVGRTS